MSERILLRFLFRRTCCRVFILFEPGSRSACTSYMHELVSSSRMYEGAHSLYRLHETLRITSFIAVKNVTLFFQEQSIMRVYICRSIYIDLLKEIHTFTIKIDKQIK